jgi:hypothetical protein
LRLLASVDGRGDDVLWRDRRGLLEVAWDGVKRAIAGMCSTAWGREPLRVLVSPRGRELRREVGAQTLGALTQRARVEGAPDAIARPLRERVGVDVRRRRGRRGLGLRGNGTGRSGEATALNGRWTAGRPFSAAKVAQSGLEDGAGPRRNGHAPQSLDAFGPSDRRRATASCWSVGHGRRPGRGGQPRESGGQTHKRDRANNCGWAVTLCAGGSPFADANPHAALCRLAFADRPIAHSVTIRNGPAVATRSPRWAACPGGRECQSRPGEDTDLGHAVQRRSMTGRRPGGRDPSGPRIVQPARA